MGKFTQALQFYARLIKKYPKHTKVFDAEMGIGWTYFELKQYARAGDSFRKILRKYKKSDEQAKAYLALGACLYNLRDLQGALKSYKTILEKFLTQHDEATEARYQMAWLHFRQNKFDEAILEFQKYIALGENEPRHADALYFSGLSYFQTGKYAEAINHFERAAHTPNAPAWLKEKALADLARSQNSAGQIADAQKTYKALIEAYPQSSVYDEALYQLVLLAFKTNDEASAIEWKGQLKAHNSKSPWYAEALRETADFYRKEKRFTLAEHALVELEEAQKKPEEKLTTLVLRASLHFEEGRDEKAKALTLKILQNEEITDATANSAAALLFRIYEKQGAYVDGEKEAVRLCTRFAENSLLKEEMLLHQAHFLTLQKKFSASREALTPLATSRHTGARARFAIAETYRAENDTTHALDFYRQITQKQDEGLYLKARFYIGQILFDRKDYEAAAREFSRVAYADSRDDATYEKALYYAARAFREIQKEKEFETFREKLKEAFPQSTYIKELETP
ncbi:MAG TPA: tetratricopeptide repeat protein [Turneriella sp.]|nr:tetratricopeptide repeat protein [Turneriella sp.]